jgi:hypothetical protein
LRRHKVVGGRGGGALRAWSLAAEGPIEGAAAAASSGGIGCSLMYGTCFDCEAATAAEKAVASVTVRPKCIAVGHGVSNEQKWLTCLDKWWIEGYSQTSAPIGADHGTCMSGKEYGKSTDG